MIIIHPATERQLRAFRTAPSHAVMLIGPTGSGKVAIAQQLAAGVLDVTNLDAYPYMRHISAEKSSSIGIEAVRELEKFMTLKVPSDKARNRIAIIEDAQLLTPEAQNALLKTLEEPPQGTILILTVSHEHSLLPTIRSRAQAITVTRPEKAALVAHFASLGHDDKNISQAYAVSSGLPGLMHALLHESDHPLTQATERVRQLLSQSTYERLLSVDELAKQKNLALDITYILQQMAHVSLQTVSGPSAKKWQRVLSSSYDAGEALTNSAQPKLVLTNLMLHL